MNTLKGRSLQPIHIYNHNNRCFEMGLNGHLGRHYFQGQCSESQQKLHISCLESEAVFLTLKHFLFLVNDKNVLIRCDNTSVVQQISKYWGTKSPQLCYRTWDLWNFAIQNNIHLKTAHILGVQNKLADRLSSKMVMVTEWSLHKSVVHQIFQNWGFH